MCVCVIFVDTSHGQRARCDLMWDVVSRFATLRYMGQDNVLEWDDISLSVAIVSNNIPWCLAVPEGTPIVYGAVCGYGGLLWFVMVFHLSPLITIVWMVSPCAFSIVFHSPQLLAIVWDCLHLKISMRITQEGSIIHSFLSICLS